MGRKYNTEEERKAARRERDRKYRENNPEKVKERNRKWRENNTEYWNQYYELNKEQIAEYKKQYYELNKEERAEYKKQRYQTPIGRGSILAAGYRRDDKKYNRGECTITGQWMVDNVFSGQICHYCGETDWLKLGVDRINNNLPHTPDNVVVCCKPCNIKRGTKSYEEFCKEMGVNQ